MAQYDVLFRPSGRGKAQCAANPAYPAGVDLDLTKGTRPSCTFELPYPAEECGMWLIQCRRCGIAVAVTAAGRADDPRSVTARCDRSSEN